MYNFLLIIFFFISISIVALVMLQPGKGCYVMSNLKTGVYSTIFFYRDYSNFITYITTIFAIIFFLLNLILCTIISNKNLENKEHKDQQNKKVYINK